MLQTYSEYSPTPFDRSGACLDDDRQDWLVLPVCRTRDSGPLDDSNVDAALSMLGGESDTVELHRFGHWGPGWFEIVLCHPFMRAMAEEVDSKLENYPVLDEEDFSQREWDLVAERWENMSVRDRIHALGRFDLSIFAARRDTLPENDNGSLYQYLAE